MLRDDHSVLLLNGSTTKIRSGLAASTASWKAALASTVAFCSASSSCAVRSSCSAATRAEMSRSSTWIAGAPLKLTLTACTSMLVRRPSKPRITASIPRTVSPAVSRPTMER